jgi:CrcB protein
MIVIGFLIAATVATLVRWQLVERLHRPAGTLLVNLLGAAALGWLSESTATTHTILGVAALGSLTTFSTLLIEILDLWSENRRHALAYIAVTIIGGVGAAWLGLRLA